MCEKAIFGGEKTAPFFQTKWQAERIGALKFRPSIRLGLLAAAVLLCTPHSAQAATVYWSVPTGDWSLPDNWGGTEPTASDDAVINYGTANVTQSGEVCAYLYLGDSLGNSGTVQMTSGSLHTTRQKIGHSGTGAFTQSGGNNTLDYSLYLGYNFGSSGTYNLSGTGSLFANSDERVGYYGTGTFTQSGGTNTMCKNLTLGHKSGSSGTYILSGGSLHSYNCQHIGPAGTGDFTQSGGTNTIEYKLYLAFDPSGIGYYTLSDGWLSIKAGLYVGYSGTGTFTQSGGTNVLRPDKPLNLGYWSGSSGTYNLNGGTLILSSISSGSGTAAFNFGGGTLQACGDFTTTLPMTLTGIGGNANINTAGYAVTLSDQLFGTGGLNKLGAGTLTLSGTNIYTGLTTIAVGTLALGIDGSLASSVIDVCGGATFDVLAKPGGYHLLSGQTIKGNGTIIGDITVDPGADWAPGSSIGTLSCTGNLTLGGNASFELGTPGTSHSSPGLSDRTVVPGNLVLGGALNLLDNGGANGQGSAGAGAYKLLTWSGSQSGTFDSVADPSSSLHAKTVVDGSDKAVYVELYRLADAAPQPVYLGTIHVGQSFATQAITIGNAAANDGYSEKLNAGIGGLNGGATAGGSFVLLAPGETDNTSLMVGLGNSDTNVAGAKNGTVTLALASDGTGTSGYGATDLTSWTVDVTGKVNLYAQPRFANAAGDAVLTMLSEQQYTLDFGDLPTDGGEKSSCFQLTNLLLAEGYQDVLGGSFTVEEVTNFTLSKFTDFSDVLPGYKKSSDLGVTFDPDQPLGVYSETLTLTPYWSNESGWGNLGEIQLTLIATVVPEPSTLAILISAAAGLLAFSLWRWRNSLASAA